MFTPYAKLYHHESISRGYETTEAKEKRFRSETELFLNKWKVELEKGDLYYNPHLTLRYENFERYKKNTGSNLYGKRKYRKSQDGI